MLLPLSGRYAPVGRELRAAIEVAASTAKRPVVFLDTTGDAERQKSAGGGSGDEVDINVKVEEKPSGALLAGLGYSQSDGIVINASVTQDNFAGTGKRVSLALQTSSANQASRPVVCKVPRCA